jgi:hypothetical protein
MFLGLSFVGWAILVAAYVPVALLLAFLAHRFRWRSKIFAITASLASLPFLAAIAEAAYVDYNWRALCATAKTEIERRVVVEGFYDAGVSSGYKHFQEGTRSSFKHGFRFVEWKDNQGRLWRTEGFDEPQLRTVRIDRPAARYHLYFAPFATPAGHLLKKRDDKIVDTQTGEVIARQVMGYRYPTFLDQAWRQWFDSAPEICGEGRSISDEVLVGVDRER